MSELRFKRLFEPTRIGQMQLKNRLVMPPMGTLYATEDGYVSPRLTDYLEARAMGGVGLIIIEVTAPDLRCRGPHQLTLGDDRYISSFRELVRVIHKHGTKVAVQLQHSSFENRNGKRIQVAPSPVIVPSTIVGPSSAVPHELTIGEISEIIQWFASAARRAKEAGLDGIEIHGAHGYLIASFLSSATNIRQDSYGNTLENKARFLIEIVQAVRAAVGPDYPVWPRLNAREYGRENGITLEETKKVAHMVIDAGVQAIHVSAYGVGSYVTTAPIADTPGFLVPMAEEIKRVSRIPVIAVGRLDIEIGERVLTEGKADLIAIGRRLMADPELPRKMAEGRSEEVTPCIGCMECIERLSFDRKGARCVTNPVMGKEKEYQLKPADKRRKITVIGGGPAGMTAARVAALRGHDVTLFEKATRLGGRLNVAGVPPHKGDIIPLIDYMTRQLKRAGVEVRLSTEATSELIMKSEADTVIVAIGGNPVIPDIPGVDRQNVVTAESILSGEVDTGQNIVIIGGGMVGCETGYFLAEKGKRVTIIEVLEEVAADMLPRVKRRLLDGLKEKQVTLLTKVTCEKITESSVTITTSEGQKQTISADTVVPAVGYEPKDGFIKTLQNKMPEVHCIGDCLQVRRIIDAIDDGYQIGLSI